LSSNKPYVANVQLQPEDNRRLAAFCGHLDENYKILEDQLKIKIRHRGHAFQLIGDRAHVEAASVVLKEMYQLTQESNDVTPRQFHLSLQDALSGMESDESDRDEFSIRTPNGMIRPKGDNQRDYLANIVQNDIIFGVGPAGTGKTFLAVLAAVEALETEKVKRLILVRPAVEAGESLGFLPGDFSQKVEPYLRPLYDALFDFMGEEWLQKKVEKNQIEVAPLAYMRGRTLNDSFIIMDEAQNTTIEQMKMFLTRLGFGSKAVITGDVTQIDLPAGKLSGLKHAERVLKGVDGITFVEFQAKDAVRHRLVQSVVKAYDNYEQEHPGDSHRY
jgi:phosphate starvation-inducible PhoH-like protein